MSRILVMGLPGSGKTTFAGKLKEYLEQHGEMSYSRALLQDTNLNCEVTWFNADDIRRKYNDWDFSNEGRIRQSIRMFQFSMEAQGDYVICDFVCPLVEMRNNFKADWTIWMDTIDAGRFEDTNKAFIPPDHYDFRITEQDADKWASYVGKRIVKQQRRPVFDWRKETVQMLGRWQPWHKGHRALFERLLEKTGQVIIQVRDVQGWQGSNPFEVEKVKGFIRRDLDPLYQGMYDIQVVPNIVHIGWGRGVGYTSGEETFDESITDISATKIRAEMGLK
ncbi:Protein KTI12/L-seryl-tRNA(Sec) kinase [uncultured Caudovirales phage]|uniref:Protein KTI12/L-seryl-tRNA(Sec) kinase n=1 Tax=uncultured Caudovirales phage TaxID=2100421 RepID=A0A6J7WG96_9CAUD|nr:Protein KTI12/L-seryl-tRNA(Sec) kinase [uncultured Caudovirales phage]